MLEKLTVSIIKKGKWNRLIRIVLWYNFHLFGELREMVAIWLLFFAFFLFKQIKRTNSLFVLNAFGNYFLFFLSWFYFVSCFSRIVRMSHSRAHSTKSVNPSTAGGNIFSLLLTFIKCVQQRCPLWPYATIKWSFLMVYDKSQLPRAFFYSRQI